MGLTARLGLTRYDADEYYKEALEQYKKRNLEEALLKMEQAIQLLPHNSEYYAVRGFFYLQDGVRQRALQDFEQALKLHPYEMLAHYGRGVIAYQDKNWDEAMAHFTDAWAAMPDRPETLYYLGLVAHRQGQQMQALNWMQQAHAQFEKHEDKRHARDAERWLRELERRMQR